MIYYGKQQIDQDDIDSVVEVLKSDLITQGLKTPEFENQLARYTEAQHAIVCSSGYAALHLACMALEVSTGDIVWTVPNTFAATASCALNCGAEVDFVDIDPQSLNISVSALEEKLEQAQSIGKTPKVVIVVHFAGNPCEMKAISKLSKEYGFYVIEDACHALGASYDGEKVGSCSYSDLTVFSFHPVKSITTGEGGALLTNQDHLAAKARILMNNGITKNPELLTNESHGGWYYELLEAGVNYRMNDIQSALGISQFKKLDKFIGQRSLIAKRYSEELRDQKLSTQVITRECQSAFHLYVLIFSGDDRETKKSLYCFLMDHGIGTNSHYIPLHYHPLFKRKGFKEGDYPNAEHYYAHSLSLPIYPSLSVTEQDTVIRAILDYFKLPSMMV